MTLNEFFAHLDQQDDSLPMPVLVRLLQQLTVSETEMAHVISFSETGYTRNVVRVTPIYAALLLCWCPGQESPIHDHHGSACGVRVIKGTLTETQFKRHPDGRLEQMLRSTLHAGKVCGSCDADIHIIGNEMADAGQNLITLHVYTPPLKHFHYYFRDDPRVETVLDVETAAALRDYNVAATTG
ncbi:MAG: hypothetical protein D8M59_10115 [Planctomycetes bacterium]|nr:hypothetical protein [Planctomycetota bacterium]NOG53387.1 cysteine dioxygenase family protein [Planctomycetota bacterium]